MSTVSLKPNITALPDNSVRRDAWLRFADEHQRVCCEFNLSARDIAELREQTLQLIDGPGQVQPNPIGDRQAEPRDRHSRIRLLVWNDRHDELHVGVDQASVTASGITPNELLDCLDRFSAEADDGRR